jgi:amidohydrolase
MQDPKAKIQSLAAEYLPDTISIRRFLHQHPELSGEEIKTAEYIGARLKEYHIPFRSGIGGNGIVAIIEGANASKKVIALRSDMDALPIREENDVKYKSLKAGVMHACGHDVHMACMLGAARIMMQLRSQLNGTVKLIFQPHEEKYPGGAIKMIKEGVLENPRPDLVIGQHVYPELEAGKIGVKSGLYMASTDEVHITVKGKGGHAAIPHKIIDPIVIAAHLILALQQIVSRNAKPTVPTVISFGRIIGDGRTNIIPDEVKLEGIIRTYDEGWRKEIQDRIVRISKGVAEGMGGTCEVIIDKGYPALDNDKEVTERVRSYAKEYLGEDHVADLEMRMTAEDFAYYARLLPSCFYRLGVMNTTRGITSNLHTSTFDADESSIETGMGFMAWIVFNELL